MLTAYLLALAIPLHLSALVAAPVVDLPRDGARRTHPSSRAYDWRAGIALAGVCRLRIGLSRLSTFVMAAGVVLVIAGALLPARGERVRRIRDRSRRCCVAAVVAFSALLFMLLRARHDPAINQGNPTTLADAGRR